jgi:hypothetical protein
MWIEDNPNTTKTGVTRLIRGAKQPILWAVDNLLDGGYLQEAVERLSR